MNTGSDLQGNINLHDTESGKAPMMMLPPNQMFPNGMAPIPMGQPVFAGAPPLT